MRHKHWRVVVESVDDHEELKQPASSFEEPSEKISLALSLAVNVSHGSRLELLH